MARQDQTDEEVTIDEALARRLLARQHPQWANLALRPVISAGTDNAIFRLGETMALRLPRLARAAGQVEKEQRWLPLLRPLPLEIPTALGRGAPDRGYPFQWSVYGWLEGENATPERLQDLEEAARALAGFIRALQAIDAGDGPLSGQHNEFRGVPLAEREAPTRQAIGALSTLFDPFRLTEAWEASLAVPPWREAPRWVHGDIQSGNLLARAGRIRAVIDFGLMGVGDPACDLTIAWSLLCGRSRGVFRDALEIDEDSWLRGRGWALSVALVALAYYLESNPVLADLSRRTIEEVLTDFDARR